MYSELLKFNEELIAAVADTTLSKARRELGLEILEKISESQVEGYFPIDRPVENWLEPETMPMRLQIDIWTCCSLGHRWWNDPSRPKEKWELMNVVPKSSQVMSVPESIVPSPVTPDFEFGEE
jgi:hypothetical protein